MASTDIRPPVPLPAGVTLEPGEGGLPRLSVENPLGSFQIYLHGAHITHWHPAGQTTPVLWMSKDSQFTAGKPIRGGVPVIFPWFGARQDDPQAPMHGFARLHAWELESATASPEGEVTFVLTWSAKDPHAEAFPGMAGARIRYTVTAGKQLKMRLSVENAGREPFQFEEALHSYFRLSDVRKVTLTGLGGTDYLDKVRAFSRHTQGTEPMRFEGETDRIFLDTRTTTHIDDPGFQRRITIEKSGSHSTVVWNPWIERARAMPDFGDDQWPEMLCVETCNVGDARVTVAPGETHHMEARVSVGER